MAKGQPSELLRIAEQELLLEARVGVLAQVRGEKEVTGPQLADEQSLTEVDIGHHIFAGAVQRGGWLCSPLLNGKKKPKMMSYPLPKSRYNPTITERSEYDCYLVQH